MTVEQMASELSLKTLNCADGEREIEGGYVGDLLSWVMGRAKSGNVWITIMSNVNIVAVALLADVSCIILSEGVMPPDDVIETAKAKGVNLFTTEMNSYEAAASVDRLLK